MDISDISSEIPDIKIEAVERDKGGDFIITVSSTAEGTICHRCGREITEFYGDGRTTELRHLPVSGHKTCIRIRPERYECPYCDDKPATTQKLTWYDRKSPHTREYEEHVLPGLVNSTVSDVHTKEASGYEAVMGITERRIESGVNREDMNRLDITGTDETALKKGHNYSVTVITSYSGGRAEISGVIGGREKQTVKNFLSEIPRRLGTEVRVVCCDMYEGYINAAEEVSGNKVIIAADRFHVAELYRKDSESLRESVRFLFSGDEASEKEAA